MWNYVLDYLFGCYVVRCPHGDHAYQSYDEAVRGVVWAACAHPEDTTLLFKRWKNERLIARAVHHQNDVPIGMK